MEKIETIKHLTGIIFAVSIGCIILGASSFFLSLGKEKRPGTWSILITGMVGICIAAFISGFGIPYLEKTEAVQAAIEHRVFTADVITVQRKYISNGTIFSPGEPFIVITDGEDTVTIKVTDGIYEKYKPGDVYVHDADPIQYDAVPSTAPPKADNRSEKEAL